MILERGGLVENVYLQPLELSLLIARLK